ncbi:MAG: hypothetical protein NTY09_13395 [bacterium]|nr:hypothetical protein [bacterium]
MSRIARIFQWGLLVVMLAGFFSIPVRAEESYPGVYSNDNSLVFVKAGDEAGGLTGIVVLSWEYSMDWIITTGNTAAMTEDSLLITDGHQYVYNADGTRRSDSEFTSQNIVVDWPNMEFRVLPTYGHYLAPMVHGGLAYALVEMQSGLPSQLVLASEAYDNGQSMNLFNGFLYQFSESELSAQISFSEVAFGSQGLLRGDFPDNFPPPPEDYPNPYPAYPEPSFPPPVSYGDNSGSNPDSSVTGANNLTMPMGTPVEPGEESTQPQFTLEPMHDYDVPPITRIGVVAFQDNGDEEGYGPYCDEKLQEQLAGIEGLEVVYIPFDSARFGGAVIYDRAVWLCQEHGVDALMLNEIDKLEIPGSVESATQAGSVRVNSEITSTIIEGTGGSEIWSGDFTGERIHDVFEVSSGADGVLKGDLMYLINSLMGDLTGSGALQGRHVD